MRVLASLVRWPKMGNVVLVTFTMMVAITVVAWMSMPGVVAKAEAVL